MGMNMKMNRLNYLAAIAPLFVAGIVSAANVIDEKWSGYANGDLPKAPWLIAQAGYGDGDAITIQDGWLFYDNGGKGANNWNPELKLPFTPVTTKLNIRFSYRMPDNGVGSQIIFSVRGSDNTMAIYLVLGKNYYYQKGMSYQDSMKEVHPIGHTFSPNETVKVELNNIDVKAKTFEIAWSSSNGESGKATGTFCGNVADLASIFIADNTGPDIVSRMYLGPVKIDSVP